MPRALQRRQQQQLLLTAHDVRCILIDRETSNFVDSIGTTSASSHLFTDFHRQPLSISRRGRVGAGRTGPVMLLSSLVALTAAGHPVFLLGSAVTSVTTPQLRRSNTATLPYTCCQVEPATVKHKKAQLTQREARDSLHI